MVQQPTITAPAPLICFQGNCAGRNALGMTGALALAQHLARHLDIPLQTLGAPGQALQGSWQEVLETIRPDFVSMGRYLEKILSAGKRPVLTMSRCAGGLATLPVVARYHPQACIVWLDAHGDLNTPETTGSGYLGGMVIAGAAGLWDSGLGSDLTLDQVILAGAHQLDPGEQALIDEGRVCHLPPSELSVETLQRAINGRPVYIHLDCDVLRAGVVPSDYQIDDGLAPDALSELMAALSRENVIGMEVAELESHWPEQSEPADLTVLVDALSPVVKRLLTEDAPCAP
ncbi:arginase family protein [Kushneria phyllosphaerae]|uniref:N(Omega)-hydroxy-L-arginine amidinohydrolase n=1 Tax=Kushneria phyllosphaerae TaxID=2100822 RepID=A0A2R8CH99_9GAMM|nr:arginase family protein [Kushneria phyllosphaerae]SPJ32260.1 N(omega)-hydroxy-L-arginine amidinohydrolase [Kushneria phyllosphaerae]